MVEWEKWLLITFIILAFTGALLVNAEQNRQEAQCQLDDCCVECCLIQSELCETLEQCKDYNKQNCEGLNG